MIKQFRGLTVWFRRQTAVWAAGEQGSTVVEYAILLAIVAGGLLLTVELLGSRTNDVLARVNNTWKAADGRSAAPPTVSPSSAQQSFASAEPTARGLTGSWFQDAFSVLSIAVLSIAWFSLSRARRREMLREKAAEVAAVQRPARFVLKRQQMMRTLSNCVPDLVEGRLHVRHLMTQEVTTALPTATLAELTFAMESQEVRHLLICDHDERLLGVVSDRDLRAQIGKSADQIMTRNPTTVAATTPIMIAVSMMLDRHFSSLPVVDGHRLVGILTTTDLAMALQCAMQLISQVTKPDHCPAPNSPATPEMAALLDACEV